MRVGQNRKSAGEKQPFRSQFVESGTRGRGLGDDHDVKSRSESRSVGADDFTKSAPGFITIHRSTDTLGSHETNPTGLRGGVLENTETEQTTLRGFSFFPDLAKVSAIEETSGFWKTQSSPLRLGCVWRSGLRHLSGEAACGRDGGGGSGWRGRPWSSCGRGSRIAVCACAWKAGMCVS